MSQETVTARDKKRGVFIYDSVDCRTSLVHKAELSKWIGHGKRYLTLEGRPFLNISELRQNVTLTLHTYDSLLGGSSLKPEVRVDFDSLDNSPSDSYNTKKDWFWYSNLTLKKTFSH